MFEGDTPAAPAASASEAPASVKFCSKCRKPQPLDFYRKTGDGLRRSDCKNCLPRRTARPAPALLLGDALVSPMLPWSGLRLALYGCPKLQGIKPRRCGPGAVWRWSLGWQPAICRSIASDKSRAKLSSCRASGKGCARGQG